MRCGSSCPRTVSSVLRSSWLLFVTTSLRIWHNIFSFFITFRTSIIYQLKRVPTSRIPNACIVCNDNQQTAKGHLAHGAIWTSCPDSAIMHLSYGRYVLTEVK